MRYAELPAHRLMIRDFARTEAFRKGIEAAVRPGDVVLDAGAGSGILALLAARAGARRVYAVEPTPAAEVIPRLARANGVQDVVRTLRSPAEAVLIPEPVDVVVSEWMGSIGVDENLLGMVLRARDRFLRPGGRMVPRRVAAWMAPAGLSMRPDVDFFRDRPYGLDLSPFQEPSVHELLCRGRRVESGNLRAAPRPLWTTDTRTARAADALLPARGEARFVARKRGTVNCLVAWFRAELSPGVLLANAPGAPDTHWGQLALPLRAPIRLEPGQVLEAKVTCIPAGRERSHLAWSVRAGGGAWEHHDTRVHGPSPAPQA